MTAISQAKDYTVVAFESFFTMIAKIERIFLVNTVIAALMVLGAAMVMLSSGWGILAIAGVSFVLLVPAFVVSFLPYLRAKSVMELKEHAETLYTAFNASKELQDQGVNGLRKRGPWKVFLGTANALVSLKMNESLPLDIKDNIFDAVKLCNPATAGLAVRSVASSAVYCVFAIGLAVFI